MPVQHYIKYAYENEEASISEIAERTGVCWRTAAKYARQDDWNEPVPGTRARRRPVMDPVAEIVDTWLLEDRLLPRKDRRNAVAIFKQLQKDHGFKGGERTVREYIQKRRGELFKGESSTYVELEHPVGEAQADFGTIHCVRDGKIVEVKSLVLSFPRSNAGFAVPVPSENTECFLEGLRTLFEQAGGVPRRLVLDNASAAVASIGEGELLTTLPRHYMLKEQPIDWAALFEIYSRRPRAAVHSAMFRHLPEAVRAYLQEVDAPDRAIRVRALRDALKAYSIDQVAEALEALPADRRANPANLELKLYALRPENRTPEPIAEDYTPLVVAAYAPDSALYDQLLPTRMEGVTMR